jgi:hypothetical protein
VNYYYSKQCQHSRLYKRVVNLVVRILICATVYHGLEHFILDINYYRHTRRMPSSGVRHRVALARTDVSEERIAHSFHLDDGVIRSSETSVLTRATRRHILQDDIHFLSAVQ